MIGHDGLRAQPSSRPRATYQDVLDAPPHKVAEVLDGRLYLQPRPAGPHDLAGSAIGGQLIGPYHLNRQGPGSWWILDEPELHFGKPPREDILVPDLAGWLRERMAEPDSAYFTIVPDWVCEILSPSTRKLDLTRKRDLYAREGVPYLWFVDPDACTLEAYELREGKWESLGSLSGSDTVRLPPFEATGFPLASLWLPSRNRRKR